VVSLRFARLFPGALICAFEPNPLTLEKLRAKVASEPLIITLGAALSACQARQGRNTLLMLTPLAISATILFSTALFYGVEAPFVKLGARLAKKMTFLIPAAASTSGGVF
jgi:hypothetical protein